MGRFCNCSYSSFVTSVSLKVCNDLFVKMLNKQAVSLSKVLMWCIYCSEIEGRQLYIHIQKYVYVRMYSLGKLSQSFFIAPEGIIGASLGESLFFLSRLS